MSIKSKVLTTLGVGAACAACCAPLLAPIILGSGTLGFGTVFGLSTFGLSLDEAVCAGLVVAALGGIGFWLWRNHLTARRAKACECETVCSTENCAPANPA